MYGKTNTMLYSKISKLINLKKQKEKNWICTISLLMVFPISVLTGWCLIFIITPFLKGFLDHSQLCDPLHKI